MNENEVKENKTSTHCVDVHKNHRRQIRFHEMVMASDSLRLVPHTEYIGVYVINYGDQQKAFKVLKLFYCEIHFAFTRCIDYSYV